MTQKEETITLRCAVCKRTAKAKRLTVSLSEIGLIEACWLKAPHGWWILETPVGWKDIHARCCNCLKVKKATS